MIINGRRGAAGLAICFIKPEAKFTKLLKFIPPIPRASSRRRSIALCRQREQLSNLLKEDFTTVSVGAFLVTYDYNLQFTVGHLMRFARSLCQNFPILQAQGHPKWREVNLGLPALGPGWIYYPPTTREIRACVAKTKAPVRPARKCSAEERILGFCS